MKANGAFPYSPSSVVVVVVVVVVVLFYLFLFGSLLVLDENLSVVFSSLNDKWTRSKWESGSSDQDVSTAYHTSSTFIQTLPNYGRRSFCFLASLWPWKIVNATKCRIPQCLSSYQVWTKSIHKHVNACNRIYMHSKCEERLVEKFERNVQRQSFRNARQMDGWTRLLA